MITHKIIRQQIRRQKHAKNFVVPAGLAIFAQRIKAMAKLQLSLSSKANKESGLKEILIRFFNGKAFNQRAHSGVYILDNTNYWDGSQMVDKRRMNDEERRYHNTQRAKIEELCRYIEEEWLKWDKSVALPSDWLKSKPRLPKILTMARMRTKCLKLRCEKG